MEATPSLACANKCVFCWRHHTNPVGTEWKWAKDSADKIVNEAIKYHYNMIKEFKGITRLSAYWCSASQLKETVTLHISLRRFLLEQPTYSNIM